MLSQFVRIATLLVAPCLIASATIRVSSTPNDVYEAEELMSRATALFDAGKYFDAIPVAERALSIRERLLGPEHPDTATSINYLGRIHRFAGNYAKAESLLKRALAIREKLFGPDHVEVARTLVNLGAVYHVAIDYDRADVLYARALRIFEQQLGHDHLETLRARNNIGLLYQDRGMFSKAEVMHTRLLETRRKLYGIQDLETAESLRNLGSLYSLSGRFSEGERLLTKAVEIRERLLGVNHPITSFAVRDLANLYIWAGDYSKGEPLAKKAVSIVEKGFGSDSIYTATSLCVLALSYVQTGSYDEADELLSRAESIDTKILGEHPYTIGILVDRAELSLRRRDYASAKRQFAKVLGIRKRMYESNSPFIATVFHGIADADFGLGEVDSAEPLYKRALATRLAMLGEEDPATISTMQHLGHLYLQKGAYPQAKPLLRQALALRERVLGPNHLDTANALVDQGILNWVHGSYRQGLTAFLRANAIESRNASVFLELGSETRKQAYMRSRADDIYKFVSYSVALSNSGTAELGLNSVLGFKGQALDMMSDNFAHLRKDAKNNMLLTRLASIANEVSMLTYRGSNFVGSTRKRMKDLAVERDRLEEEIASRSQEFRRQIAPVSADEVAHSLPTKAALIEWLRYLPFDPKKMGLNTQEVHPRYVAYVLKRDSSVRAIDLGDALELDALVNQFRIAVSDPKNDDYRQSAIKIYRAVLKPIERELQGVDHLFVSPDGELNLLPVEALIDERGEYLSSRVEVSYLTTGRDLLKMESEPTSEGGAIVMADPNFGPLSGNRAVAAMFAQRSSDLDRSGFVFRPLSNTRLEAQDLGRVLDLKPENLYFQDDATEANLKNVHGPRILHVASHGFFLSDADLSSGNEKGVQIASEQLRENPLLRSGLALAGANLRRSGKSDDGILSALEVAQLDLQGTELVVLSACDTGIGDVQNGEGVYGLRRALVLAGAQTQVTSLWKVSDEATRKLMVDFYERLMKGEGRSAALRHAQQDMQSSSEYAHPYYWASFVPIGDWRPITSLH